MVRTTCCEKTGLKRGAWTPEEDRKLSAYIKRYGHWNWRELPKHAGLLRCGKSCRLRWVNYLKPDIKRGGYTKEEEEIIMNLHENLGNRWSAIAAKLPGRTDNEIKNYWHTHLKKRLKPNSKGLDKEKKLQAIQRESNRKKTEAAAEPISACSFHSAATPTVLESSSVVPPSPKKISCDLSSSKTDSDDHALISRKQEEGAIGNNNSSGIFAEFNGSFWTEPFLVADQDYPELEFPLCDDQKLTLAESLLCSYEVPYSDDSMDSWFSQLNLAGELPGIWMFPWNSTSEMKQE